MSNAFTALIWWVIPAGALIGALGYVLWVTQFKDRYETQTSRSVDQFQRFQGAFNQARVINVYEEKGKDPNKTLENEVRSKLEIEENFQRGVEK